METLSELLHLHDDLDGMFFDHQCALLRFDFNKAFRLLEAYESALLIHMKDEEDVLTPIYRERTRPVKAGNVQFFLDEHAKMRAWIELFKNESSRLAHVPEPEADLLILLDREAFYKRLCSHHDKREADIFYPEMDRITSTSEKIELLSRITRTFSTVNIETHVATAS